MKQYLYIGLGNPGKKFERARHNLGIRLLHAWVQQRQPQATLVTGWHNVEKFEAALAEIIAGDAKITCLFPLTFMNNSGQAVRLFLRKRLSSLWRPTPPLGRTLIIHDELELPLGEFRLKEAGSARGHKGVRSIHDALGTQNIPRLLLGIGPKPTSNASEYVLENFSPAEEEKITQLIPKILATLNSPHNPTDEQGPGA